MNEFEKLIHKYGEKNRLEILAALNENDQGMTYSELKEKLNFSPNALRFNLYALIEAGLVEASKPPLESKSIIFKITKQGRAYLEYLKENVEK
jgi:DNA-binding transcriptional ArsR family regulator